MITLKVNKNCTACSACANICPKTAITMTPNREGFLYPIVNTDYCVDCMLCETVCPILNPIEMTISTDPYVFAAWNLNEEIRINSTSGGVFSALASAFIEKKGYIVGAAYGSNFEIYHIIIQDETKIELLRQSKYAQSNINEIYLQIEKLLVNGELVLFCGTPCQSAGLQKFLRKEYPNLYCCDFICRGVISQKVFQKYLDDIVIKNKSKPVKVQFKNKDFGWNLFSTKITFHNGQFYQKNRYEDPYMRGYLKHNLYLRPSCYHCMFKSFPRVSDITLGDFWGIGFYNSELDDDKGTSAVIINTEKGKALFELAKPFLRVEKRTLQEVLSGNSCLLNSPSEGQFQKYFFDNFEKIPFDILIKRIDVLADCLSVRNALVSKIKTLFCK